MVQARRFKYFIIATIVCAVLLCAALFSVSFAAWGGGSGSATAEVDGKAAKYYVEYPQYVTSDDIGIPVLEENKYYLQVPQKDDRNISDYYEMEACEKDYDGNNQIKIENVPIYAANTVVNVYQGTQQTGEIRRIAGTKGGSVASAEYVDADHSIKITQDGYYSFYYQFDSYLYMYVGRDGDIQSTTPTTPSTGNTGATFDTTGYSNKFTVHFSDDPVGVNKTMYFKTANGAPANYNNVNEVSAYIWTTGNYYYTDKNKGQGNNTNGTPAKVNYITGTTLNVGTKADTNIIFGFGDSWSYKTLDLKLSDYAKEEVNCITMHTDANKTDNKPIWDKGGSGTGGSGSGGGSTTTIIGAEPVTTGATALDAETESNDLAPVRYAVMHNDNVKDEAKGGYVYRNYVSISRKNSASTINDNSIAFVEFGIYNLGVDIYNLKESDKLSGASNVDLVSFNWTRVNTDSKGTLTSGTAATSPRIYNYDTNKEGGVKLSDIGPGFWHDKNHTITGDPIDESKHMVEHFDTGMYGVLFFGDNEQQYFALEIEIVTETYIPDFALVVSANNINRWQRYKDGYGQPYSFYLGGLINNVWTWDPRRTFQMSGTEITEANLSEPQEFTDGSGATGDTYTSQYPIVPIDISLTVNLTAGSEVKAYMLGSSGYRYDPDTHEKRHPGEPVPTDGRVSYMLPNMLVMPDGLAAQFRSAGKVFTKDSNLNLIIPVTGEYTFRFVGSVSSGRGVQLNSNGGVSGVTGSMHYLGNSNYVIEKLYISTAETSAEDYTVTFNSNGGSAVASQTVKFGQSVTEPAEPTKTDCTFKGWYIDNAFNTKWNFASDVVTSTITLYAKWVGNEFDVTFNANDGKFSDNTETKTITTVNQTIASANIPTPTRDGYSFEGWSEARSGAVIDDMSAYVYSTQTLYAQWTKLNYNITFYYNYDEAPNSGVYATQATKPTDPKLTGHTFGGWYENENCTGAAYTFSSDLAANKDLYAKWTGAAYSVNNGTLVEMNKNPNNSAEYSIIDVSLNENDKVSFMEDGKFNKYKVEFGSNGIDISNTTTAVSNIKVNVTAKFNITVKKSGDVYATYNSLIYYTNIDQGSPAPKTEYGFVVGRYLKRGMTTSAYEWNSGYKMTLKNGLYLLEGVYLQSGDSIKVRVPVNTDSGAHTVVDGNCTSTHYNTSGNNINITYSGMYSLISDGYQVVIYKDKTSITDAELTAAYTSLGYKHASIKFGSKTGDLYIKGAAGIYYYDCETATPSGPVTINNTAITASSTNSSASAKVILTTQASWGTGQSPDLTVKSSNETAYYIAGWNNNTSGSGYNVIAVNATITGTDVRKTVFK